MPDSDDLKHIIHSTAEVSRRLVEAETTIARMSGITDTLEKAYVPRSEIEAMRNESKLHTERAVGTVRIVALLNTALLIILLVAVISASSAIRQRLTPTFVLPNVTTVQPSQGR